MARRHLAIFLKGMAEKILDGRKTIDVRLSQSRIPPYLSVQKDDEIFLKTSGGKIIGKVKIDNCLYYDQLTPEEIEKIEKNYNNEAAIDEKFWQSKKNARFATVIFLKNPSKFLTSIIFKKNDRRAWVVLNDSKEQK